MTDLTIGGATFHVEVDGDPARPTLILSNALGTDLTMWDGQMPTLTEHFHVVRYDVRGHGRSTAGAAPVSIAQLGRDALAILDSLEIAKAHWVGLSMGGAVGLWVLANAPERIERAVLANTAPRLGTPDVWNARIAAVLAEGMEGTAAATIERWFSADFSERDTERVAAIHQGLKTTSPQGYAACCAALRDMDLREALRSIEHEVLVVTGHDDPVVPTGDAKAFVAGLGTVGHVALEARHMSNIEARDAFNAAVLSFLTAKPAARTAKAAPRKARRIAPAKAAPAKRGGAKRRSSAARIPLKKTTAKATKKPARVTGATKKLAAPHRRPAAKKSAAKIAATKTAAIKTSATKKASIKTAIVKTSATKPRKKAAAKVTARRPTPTTTARGPVKVAVKKAKPGKVAVKVKKIAKSAVVRKTAKSPTKKLPAARRKPATKARRPTGRRKP